MQRKLYPKRFHGLLSERQAQFLAQAAASRGVAEIDIVRAALDELFALEELRTTEVNALDAMNDLDRALSLNQKIEQETHV